MLQTVPKFKFHVIINRISFFFAGLNRLKKSVETFKKKNETNVDSLQNNLEQSLESLTSKLSNFESRHQDNVSHLDHLKQSLSKSLIK